MAKATNFKIADWL